MNSIFKFLPRIVLVAVFAGPVSFFSPARADAGAAKIGLQVILAPAGAAIFVVSEPVQIVGEALVTPFHVLYESCSGGVDPDEGLNIWRRICSFVFGILATPGAFVNTIGFALSYPSESLYLKGVYAGAQERLPIKAILDAREVESRELKKHVRLHYQQVRKELRAEGDSEEVLAQLDLMEEESLSQLETWIDQQGPGIYQLASISLD